MEAKYYLYYFFILFFFVSCAKENDIVKSPFEQESAEPISGDMKFQLRDYTYGIEEQPFTNYEVTQLNGAGNGHVTIERANIWYDDMPIPVIGDSVKLSMPIYFGVSKPDTSSIDTFIMRFDFWEQVENIVEVHPNEFRYNERKELFKMLAETNWMGNVWNENNGHLQFGVPGVYSPVSNGWYFEDEILIFNDITFNERNGLISMAGSFDVYLKQMSCGFWITHQVKGASFTINI